jgi:DNA-binding IclR family transcriptional regulator
VFSDPRLIPSDVVVWGFLSASSKPLSQAEISAALPLSVATLKRSVRRLHESGYLDVLWRAAGRMNRYRARLPVAEFHAQEWAEFQAGPIYQEYLKTFCAKRR